MSIIKSKIHISVIYFFPRIAPDGIAGLLKSGSYIGYDEPSTPVYCRKLSGGIHDFCSNSVEFPGRLVSSIPRHRFLQGPHPFSFHAALEFA